MQYPVPQFTDVEDKIIGPLTVKQFGIVFVTGVIVFTGYSVTKSILVLIFLFVLFGIPALALAFVPFNGRPIYSTLGNLIKFLSSPKELVFHKEAQNSNIKIVKDAEVESVIVVKQEVVTPTQTKDNLKEVQKLLRETANREKDIIGKM